MIKEGATAVSYSASYGVVFLGLTIDEWGIAAAVIGIIGVIATFGVNFWFRHQHLKIAKSTIDQTQ